MQAIGTALNFVPKRVCEPKGWIPHTPLAATLVRALEPKLLVELGTHSGNSYFAFCQTVDEFKISTLCYAVDTWCGDSQAGAYDESVYQHVSDYNQANYSKFSYLLRMTFNEAAAQFADESIDILHIDGLHTYDAVKQDFQTWLPKVRMGGIILFHDIYVRHNDFGVWRLWDELKATYSHTISFPHAYGLGLLVKGEPRGNEAAFLRQLTEKSWQQFWRGLYARSGEHVLRGSRVDQGSFLQAQVYISEDGNYSEARSEKISYAPGKMVVLRFMNLSHMIKSDRICLRFDPMDQTGDVQISRITIVNDDANASHVVLKDYDLSNEVDLTPDSIHMGNAPLSLFARTNDSKILLKPFDSSGASSWYFEVEILADPTMANMMRWLAERTLCIEAFSDQISQLERQLQERDNKIESLQTRYKQMETLQKTALAQEAEAQKRILQLVQAMNQRDVTIATLRTAVDQEKRITTEMREQIETQRKTAAAQDKKAQGRISQLGEAVSERDVTITTLRIAVDREKRISAEIREQMKILQKTSAAQTATLQEQVGQLAQNIAAGTQGITVLKKQVGEQKIASENMAQQICTLQQECVKYAQQIEQLNQQVTTRDDQLVTQQATFRETQKKNALTISEYEQKIRLAEESLHQQRNSIHALRSSWLGQVKDVMSVFKKPDALPKGCQGYIDMKPSGFFVKTPFTLAGWFADEKAQVARQIRVIIGTRRIICNPSVRPDVCRHFSIPEDSAQFGFHQQIKTGAGLKLIILEIETQAGITIEIYRRLHFMRGKQDASGSNIEQDYQEWLQKNTKNSSSGSLPNTGLLISVLMPVYNTPEKWLRKAIESVVAQSYSNWELCIANDASTKPYVKTILDEYAKSEKRIHVVHRKSNGHIAEASNSALEMCQGEFTALFDHDDMLAPHALARVAHEIQSNPNVAYLYSDEDKIDTRGRRFAPYFKPDYLPDLLTGQNFISHLSVIRTDLIRNVGGFRKGFEGSQDWDLALRSVDQISPAQVRHIPEVLYHWRAIDGSTALSVGEKNYTVTAAEKAIKDHFERKNIKVNLIPVAGNNWRVIYPVPQPAPLVSLIIPTRNRVELVRMCVTSILTRSTYSSYEIIIVDNQSDDPETLSWLDEIQKTETRVRVLKYEKPFNFSAINNFAVKTARGTIIGLINNDLEVITQGWMEEMVAHAVRPEIGAVGAMLYYPDNTIQHAGVLLGVGGVANHAFLKLNRQTAGYFNRARLVQNYSAVTAACLLIKKSIYEKVGGLNEEDLAVAFNDIDFCLRVKEAGYLNLWTPFAEFYHHESASRGVENTPEKVKRFTAEVNYMRERWEAIIDTDPAYNLNLSKDIGYSFKLTRV